MSRATRPSLLHGADVAIFADRVRLRPCGRLAGWTPGQDLAIAACPTLDRDFGRFDAGGRRHAPQRGLVVRELLHALAGDDRGHDPVIHPGPEARPKIVLCCGDELRTLDDRDAARPEDAPHLAESRDLFADLEQLVERRPEADH